jgi:hypothetical protein
VHLPSLHLSGESERAREGAQETEKGGKRAREEMAIDTTRKRERGRERERERKRKRKIEIE